MPRRREPLAAGVRPDRTRRCAAGVGSLLLVLVACGGLGPTRVFDPIGDFETTSRPSRAEGGLTARVTPPPGVSWSGEVLAFAEVSGSGSVATHYELRLTFVDRANAGGSWRLEPLLDQIELVDDEGSRFPCTRARVPEPPAETSGDRTEASSRTYSLLFDVPAGYRFQRIGTVAVHWALVVGGDEPRHVTSRFRVL